ncbi:hypothetical protein PLESTB_000012700 [Pleodorina starrii]|uniref:mRNA guanylyltransferase n=1 Tax=Pleodorina starrii TaxID=330485 RepID=A0A9W6B9Z4_9CHLO|nr:hypothetical protein PLESTM_001122100 [Pleodorina starrii]GLC47661.1 hypothetical protein PLESTB_000012700 [Pleodorina starrii]GLC70927.1 hypothetical protein PLESTF_001047500 [Pleodorina starrii]
MSNAVAPRYVPQLPEGWVKCPKFGDPRLFEGLNIIPCKVPLSTKFNQLVGPSGRWTLADAIRQFRGYGMDVATVIDLTKSRNYYDFNREMEELGAMNITYVKVACRGRGESPQPSEVNEAVWHIFTHHSLPETQNKYILLHCTHGFNRTGYMIVAALVRLRRDRAMTVRRALQRFAQARPPGIYKDQYINDLFKYYHEGRDARIVTPRVPAWKGSEDAEDAADAANEDEGGAGEGGAAGGELPVVTHHEDIFSIGERVCPEEADWVKSQVCGLLGSGARNGSNLRFPGMQPVSLSMDRLGDLSAYRYHVTWKADGTRYMVFIVSQGTYIMDRSFNVVRCEMRFMNGSRRPAPGKRKLYPVGKPLHGTLLDGEMVLDVDPEGKQPPRLRYLIYDLCMINNTPLMEKPWKERYAIIESHIIVPRKEERDYIDKYRIYPFVPERAEYDTPPFDYYYGDERFSVRKKEFWPVWKINKVFARFNDPHNIGHESDGLILQGYEDPYVVGTCERLYKWKFAHMNSVDFLLRCAKRPGPDGQPLLDDGAPEPLQLMLLDQNASGRGRGGIAYVPLAKIDPDGHYQVEFPPDVDPLAYDGKLVECTFDRDRGLWMFMRERRDKDTPNASRVYLRIKDSILNHVDQDLLVGILKDALLNQQAYAADRVNMNPQEQEALRKEVEAWHKTMQLRQEQQQMHAAARRTALAGEPYSSYDDNDEEQPVSPPPASPPPPGYFDDDFQEAAPDFVAEAYGDDDGGGGGHDAYKVSDADADAHAPMEGVRGPGGGEGAEGQEDGRPRRRLTRWPFDVDEPYPGCPVYEGFGFD